MAYVELIRRIVARHYDRDILFYDNGKWYSRIHCRYIDLDELEEFILRITNKSEYYD